MIDSPLVSIVLPTYNRSHRLRQAVQSCRDQTYTHWELILVDDGSADDTPHVIAEFTNADRRIRSVRHPTNRGLPAALNRGFAQTHGDLLTWTSDDNAYQPNALDEMTAFLRTHPNVDLVYADHTSVHQRRGTTQRIAVPPPEQLGRTNCVRACFLYRRAVYERIGNYAEDLPLAEDYDYWLRVSTAFTLAALHKDLYLYRCHPDSLTERRYDQIMLAAEQALRRNLPQMNWMTGPDRAQAYMRLVYTAQQHRRVVDATRYLAAAVRYAPGITLRELSLGKLCDIVLGPRPTAAIKKRLRPGPPRTADTPATRGPM